MDKELLSLQPQQPNAPAFDDVPPPSYMETINETNPLPFQRPANEVVNPIHVPEQVLTEEEVRRIMMAYSSDHRNYISKTAVKRMKITKIEYAFVHAYTMESFTQTRQSSWEYQTYKFGRIDDQTMGRIPDIWEYAPPIGEVEPFKNHNAEFILPHSEYIQPCHACSPVSRSCWTCSGNNKLKYYLKCRIIWSNYSSSFLSKPKIIPKEQLIEASGTVVYNVRGPSVIPIEYIPNEELSKASVKFIETHRDKFKQAKVLMQRHHVRLIPVNTVHYSYDGQTGRFFIYGNEWKVYCPNFPVSTCSLM